MPNEAISTLPHNWALAVFLLGVLGMCAFMLLVSSVLGSKSTGRSKNEPFESGIVGTGDTRLRLSVKFYLVAMLFVIFDAEALYLFAWSSVVREAGWPGFVGAGIFTFILIVGLIYEASIGALDWSPESRRQRQAKLKRSA